MMTLRKEYDRLTARLTSCLGVTAAVIGIVLLLVAGVKDNDALITWGFVGTFIAVHVVIVGVSLVRSWNWCIRRGSHKGEQ